MLDNGVTHKCLFAKETMALFREDYCKKKGQSEEILRYMDWTKDESLSKLWWGDLGMEIGKLSVGLLKNCRNNLSVRIKSTIGELGTNHFLVRISFRLVLTINVSSTWGLSMKKGKKDKRNDCGICILSTYGLFFTKLIKETGYHGKARKNHGRKN